MIWPRATLMTMAPGLSRASRSLPIKPSVSAMNGAAITSTSQPCSTSSNSPGPAMRSTNSGFGWFTRRRMPITRMPNACARRATSCPVVPKPTMVILRPRTLQGRMPTAAAVEWAHRSRGACSGIEEDRRDASATSADSIALIASASVTACMKFTWGNRSRSRWTCDFGTRQNSTGQTVNMRMFMPSKIKEMAGTTLDTDIDRSAKDDLSKLYHVIILNDDDHTFEYVIELLHAIFGLPFALALAHTVEADSTGSSIVFTTTLKEAEHKRDQIH